MAENPYYVPSAQSTLGQSLIGLGQIAGENRRRKEAEAKKQKVQQGFMEAFQSNNPDKVAEFVSKNPESAKLIDSMMNFKDKRSKDNWKGTMRDILANPEPQAMQESMVNRLKYLESVGADTTQTEQGLQLLGTDPEAFLRNTEMGFAAADDKGYKALKNMRGGGDAETRVRSTIFLGDGTMVQSTDTGPRVYAPDGRLLEGKAAELAIREGRKQKIEDAKDKAGAVSSQKKIAARQQEMIDVGYEAASNYPNLSRAENLLDLIETGGVDKASIRAKQIFGVESADEAELSFLLSKSVLKQLKPTFGAAFTVEESNKLDRIEAGLGKSTAGNRRLIKQAKRVIERAAKRGIRAAERAGDFETAREIQESLDFTLDVADESKVAVKDLGAAAQGAQNVAQDVQQQAQPVTATGADGSKIILINGQWVKQ